MNISAYLRRVARGKNGAENLSRQEAAYVLAALLTPGADSLQLGAFLIAERMKGESSEELAGFVDAARRHVDGFGDVHAPASAVDVACYAGKRRAAPAYLIAALRAQQADIPVLLHGMSHIGGRLSAWHALQAAGVRRAGSLREAGELLAGEGIAYLDLQDVCTPLHTLTGLRPRLGVRTFAHTVARLLNPLCCAGQINGVFHTPYVALMTRANVLLQQPRSLIFMGAEGEPELYADRQKLLSVQQGDEVRLLTYAGAHCEAYPRQAETGPDQLLGDFSRMLAGDVNQREATVIEHMQRAIMFASNGQLPQAWQGVDLKNDQEENQENMGGIE